MFGPVPRATRFTLSPALIVPATVRLEASLLLVIEPSGHVSAGELDEQMAAAAAAGFALVRRPVPGHPLSAELVRP